VGMWWLSGDVVAEWGSGGSEGMWWLSGDVVAQRGCGGSVGMWWFSGDVGMWWLSWLRQLDRTRQRTQVRRFPNNGSGKLYLRPGNTD
jgi:hypothetical protein